MINDSNTGSWDPATPQSISPVVVSSQAARSRARRPLTIEEHLFDSGSEYDFFQAVMLLESIYPDRQKVGAIGEFAKPPAIRFSADASSMSFAASAIHQIQPATNQNPIARMTVGFMGLTGPAGILPPHYTELIRRIEFEARGPQKHALRDWFDLFNDRLIALFYRSWKKYCPHASFHDALFHEHADEVDGFTTILQSACGVGLPSLRRQIHRFVPGTNIESVAGEARTPGVTKGYAPQQLALMRYAGLLAQRPRSAANLKTILEDYFGDAVDVQQFHGNWLEIDTEAQTQLGVANANCVLGQDAVVGNQSWERQNKLLIRIGPISKARFAELIPDRDSSQGQNPFQLLTDLIRLFIGPDIDFDIQLDLEPSDVPVCQLSDDPEDGLRLGWNAWLPSEESFDLASDAVFCSVG